MKSKIGREDELIQRALRERAAVVHARAPGRVGVVIPDPSSELIGGHSEKRVRFAGKRQEGFYHKKAAIFAAARRALVRSGCNGVHLRSLANDCSISAQTLYNVAGGRKELLDNATAEYSMAIIRSVRPIQTRYPSYSIAIADAFVQAVLEHPAFFRHLTQDFYSAARPLHMAQACVVAELSKSLLEQQLAGVVREVIDVPLLAYQLCTTVGVILLDWAHGVRAPESIRKEVAQGWVLMLMSASRPAERQAMDAWLALLN